MSLDPVPQPLIIVWRVTERCDLGCRFCEYSRHLQRSRLSADPGVVAAFGAVLAEYQAAYRRPVHVSWLGGEPLLWPDLDRVNHLFKHGLGLQTGLTTNGTRLASAELRRRLIEDYDQVTVSLDGLAHWHDTARDCRGLFARVAAGMQTLCAAKGKRGQGPLVRVNTILMRSNLSDFGPFARMLADWGVNELTFNTLGGQAGEPFYEQERLLPEHVAEFRCALPDLRAQLAGLGLQLRGSPLYLQRLSRQAEGQPWPIDDCRPGQQFLFVDETGTVAPCSFTSQGCGVPLGEIATAADLAALPARFSSRRAESRLPPCADCHSTQVFGKFVPVQSVRTSYDSAAA